MIKNLTYKLSYTFILCFRKFMGVLFFIYEIIRHPMKNISIWLVALLSLLIYVTLSIEIKEKNMFLMSIGLVSIITFISNFLEKQTIDINNKDNFYLGYNIKKMKIHNNFWFKRFNELQVKLLFWIIAIFPVITICIKLKYNSKVLNEIIEIIFAHTKYINSIWLATFIVCSFYCTALLIESVNVSRESFSQSYFYKITNNFERQEIKIEIEQSFEEVFNNIFNIKSRFESENNFYRNVEKAINYIVNRAIDVSASNSEIIEFYNIAFRCERNKIDDLLNKVYKYTECEKDKKINSFINNYMLGKILKLLKLYYIIKWNTLIKLDVLSSEVINIAILDLRTLLEIETNLHENEKYKSIFWGTCTDDKSCLPSKEKEKNNLCVSKICTILKEKFRDIDFLNQHNIINRMMKLFYVLNEIDKQIENKKYLFSIYQLLFEHIIDSKNKYKKFTKLFFDKMKKQSLPEYLIIKSNEVSKNILLSHHLISNNILKYLLSFLPLEDVIVTLIFRLAYAERSGKAIMNIDEFKVWQNATYKLLMEKDIDDLKESKFIDKLCSEISKSYVSHFIFGQFIEWMWSSLFEKFDEKKYEEFIKIGKEKIRRDFNLDSYIIVRLLLCNYSYSLLWIHDFKDENKKQIKNDLFSIKDILKTEGIYI